jgi:hypothetical protein
MIGETEEPEVATFDSAASIRANPTFAKPPSQTTCADRQTKKGRTYLKSGS